MLLCASGAVRASEPSPPKWRTHLIDYSAANQFCETYYGRKGYFPNTMAKEEIFDGRKGVYDDKDGSLRPASLSSCGFALHHSPTTVTDWSRLDQINDRYLPELAEVIHEAFSDEDGPTVSHVVFWNPMLRGEGFKPDNDEDGDRTETSRSGIASMAHLDTDFLVFEGDTEEVVRLIERNRVESLLDEQPAPGAPLVGRGRELADMVKGSRRFAVVNAWRNISPSGPICRAPLAVLATRYEEGATSVVPEASPCAMRSHWYVFPKMQEDEVLLFTQYDRSVKGPSDIWHCALPHMAEGDDPAALPPRRSFEVRCFVVFAEDVPAREDRFSGDAVPRVKRLE